MKKVLNVLVLSVVKVLEDLPSSRIISEKYMKVKEIINAHIVADVLVKEFGFIDTSKYSP